MQLADDVEEDSLAGLFYTGGTTGAAKGVMLSHRNLVANALHIIIALRYSDADRYLHCAPMFHLADGASTYAVTWTGGTHVFVPAFEPVAVHACDRATSRDEPADGSRHAQRDGQPSRHRQRRSLVAAA